MIQNLRYRRTNLKIESNLPIRKRVCCVCGKTGKTDLHHYHYAYETKEVEQYPVLALDNTIELCFTCHQVADALRKIEDNRRIASAIITLINMGGIKIKKHI